MIKPRKFRLSLLEYSLGWDAYKGLPRFKGKGYLPYHLMDKYQGVLYEERRGWEKLLQLSLENTVFQNHIGSEYQSRDLNQVFLFFSFFFKGKLQLFVSVYEYS